jgi:hypothetical protein
MYSTENMSLGTSFLDHELWAENFPNMSDKIAAFLTQAKFVELQEDTLRDNELEQALLSLFTPEFQKALHVPGQRELLPEEMEEVRLAIETRGSARLHHDTPETIYLEYLYNETGIDPNKPDIVEAFNTNTQKAIAHTALAYEHLTERESRLVSLNDMPTIIANAWELYLLGLKPWWDLAVSADVSSKSEHDVNGKVSAPLFKDKDCPTIFDFFTKVIPKIFEIREKDPKAAMKIFPQSKNVEAFNWHISHDEDGNLTWIFEWYPGYTPRDGEDKVEAVVNNHKVAKEQRIVRAIVNFDKDGNAIIGLKPQKDYGGNDIPFAYPTTKINIADLFQAASIKDNQDDKVPSNNPFVFIKCLATNSKIRELITRFEKVHDQFGDTDLVVSGMISPTTAFFMDIDVISRPGDKSDRDSIQFALQNLLAQPSKIPHATLLDNFAKAPIVPESDLASLDQTIKYFRKNLTELFRIALDDSFIDTNLLAKINGQLNHQSSTSSIDLAQLVTPRELEIIQQMEQLQIDQMKQSALANTLLEKHFHIRQDIGQFLSLRTSRLKITLKREDILQAMKRGPINSQTLFIEPFRVADL